MTTKNKLFPGRPNYIGPNDGYFALLHHDQLFEKSDNMKDRVDYITCGKPESERAVRLWNIIYLPFVTDTVHAKYKLEEEAAYDQWQLKRDALKTKRQLAQKAFFAQWQRKWKVLLLRPVDTKWQLERKTLDTKWQLALDALKTKWQLKRKTLDTKWQLALDAIPVRREVWTFVKKHIPDCPWNGRELIFSEHSPRPPLPVSFPAPGGGEAGEGKT